MNKKDEQTRPAGQITSEGKVNINVDFIKSLLWFRVIFFESTVFAKICGGKYIHYIQPVITRGYIDKEDVLGMFTFKGIPETKMKLSDIYALSSMAVDKYIRARLEEFEGFGKTAPTLSKFLKDIEKDGDYIEDVLYQLKDYEWFRDMVDKLRNWETSTSEDGTIDNKSNN